MKTINKNIYSVFSYSHYYRIYIPKLLMALIKMMIETKVVKSYHIYLNQRLII